MSFTKSHKQKAVKNKGGRPPRQPPKIIKNMILRAKKLKSLSIKELIGELKNRDVKVEITGRIEFRVGGELIGIIK